MTEPGLPSAALLPGGRCRSCGAVLAGHTAEAAFAHGRAGALAEVRAVVEALPERWATDQHSESELWVSYAALDKGLVRIGAPAARP
jgi:hypothetical protein